MFVSVELILMSIFFFFIGLSMYVQDELIYLEWDLISVSGVDFFYSIYLDSYGMMFMSVILLISAMICVYSFWYVDLYKIRFYFLMLGFILSMLVLVISPNLMGMLLGWDGLGFVSFCLVLFYYDSDGSLDNSLVTLYYNRLGDGFLLVSISMMVISLGGCGGLMWDFGVIISIMMLMGLSTKSAQFPFMSWLPKAMAAPTPVSSLVHSSTLVTAGVYIMFRFCDSIGGSFLYSNISLLTMFISGVLALFEMDLKKVIAYSTLSQLGLMVCGLSLKMGDLVYFHMLSHAVFKSMMFMSGGVLIHELGGWQDLRYYGSCLSNHPISSMCLLAGSFSLSGIYFLSGYYSKDVLIELFMMGSVNSYFYWVFYFCMILTLLYSLRLLDYLCFSFARVSYSGFNEGMMSLSMGILYLGSVIYGWMLSVMILGFGKLEYVGVVAGFYILILNWFVLMYLCGGSWFYLWMYLNMDVHKVLKNLGMFLYPSFLDKYWVESYGGGELAKWLYVSIYNMKDYSVYLMFMMMFFIYFLV